MYVLRVRLRHLAFRFRGASDDAVVGWPLAPRGPSTPLRFAQDDGWVGAFKLSLRAVLLLAIALAIVGGAVAAPSVSTEAGNIRLTDGSGVTKQFTSTGHDAEPVLSPDGRCIVFVRAIPGDKIQTSTDEVEPSELWQIRADGKEPTRLVGCRKSEKMEEVIAGFGKPQFSCDGRYVFFETPAWTTSSAVHVVDTTNAKEHFVCAGGDVEVVCAGEYRDGLLVQQHRYFIGGGSYDWYWLLRPDGKEVGPVGEDTSTFKATYSNE